MTTKAPPRLVFTLILLTAVSLMSFGMFLPSLGTMASEFEVGYETMTLSVSGYLAFTAILQLIIGPLADRYGRRPVLLASFVMFSLASIGCSVSNDFSAFLFFRVLQGSVITGAALSRAVVSDIAEPQKAASILGYIAMSMSLAPILSPAIGGIISEFAGWRANFWVYTGLGFALWFLIWFQLPETRQEKAVGRSTFITSYAQLLRSLHFWGYALLMALSLGAFYVFISGVPFVGAEQMELSQVQIGLGMGSITIGFLVGSFLSGKLSKSRELINMILLGRCVSTVGLTACLPVLLIGGVSPWNFFGGTLFVGLGNGLSMPSANSAVMFVRKDLSATASGLSGSIMVAMGAVLSAFTGVILKAQPSAITLTVVMLILSAASLLIAVWISRDLQKFSNLDVTDKSL